MPGRTLEERLRRDGALPADDVLGIARQVCAGLEHAHANGLVHRDLKPGNLIERDDGTIKIADFGIARAVEGTELTEAGTVVGTAAYLAPEQAEAGTVTPATDLFALGAVLYELLTGRQPWKVESLAQLASRREVTPPELPADTPPGLREAIERSLRPDAEDRPSSAAEFARLLDADGGGPGEDATVVIPRAAPRTPPEAPSDLAAPGDRCGRGPVRARCDRARARRRETTTRISLLRRPPRWSRSPTARRRARTRVSSPTGCARTRARSR